MIKQLFIFLFPLFVFSQSSLNHIEDLVENKQYNKAEQLINNYLIKNPLNNKAIELQGDIFGFQKKWDDAINSYKKLVSINYNNANYHYKYGGALGMKALSVSKFEALGIIGDVKKSFLKAAELDKNHIDTRWALVELYMQLPGIIGGSKSKALLFANELESLSKVDGYLSKGYIYEYDKEPQLAEKYYRLAVNVGGSKTCYDKLISFYKKQNLPEKAQQANEEFQKKYQSNSMD